MDRKIKEIAFPKKPWVKYLEDNKGDFKIAASNPLHVEFVNKLVSMGNTFIEFGSGSGYMSTYVANRSHVKSVQGLDIYPELIKMANETKDQNFLGAGALDYTTDPNDLKPAEIVYSDGLIEHYEDDDIVELIEQMKKLATRAVVINMPSMFYPWTQFGNERFCQVKGQELAYWEKKLEPFKEHLTELYYYGNKFFILGVIEGWAKKQTNKKNSKR